MKHLHFSASQLRQAYRQAGARPGRGEWYHYNPCSDREYRCPLSLIYDVASVASAVLVAGSPPACIEAFTRGWDGDQAVPNECEQCFALGAKLRAELNPIWIDG